MGEALTAAAMPFLAVWLSRKYWRRFGARWNHGWFMGLLWLVPVTVNAGRISDALGIEFVGSLIAWGWILAMRISYSSIRVGQLAAREASAPEPVPQPQPQRGLW